MFFYKIHETKFGTLIAACDKELSGKTLKDKNIEVFVNPRFYGGEEIGEEILNLVKQSKDGNVIGKKIVKLLLKNNIISKKSVIKIEGIPHAQFAIL